MEKFNQNNEDFAELLNKATQHKPTVDLTRRIMDKIQVLEIKNFIFNKYIKLSWTFIVIAVILAIKVVSYLPYFEATFSQLTDGYLPGTIEFFIYMLICGLAGLFFFQLNSLLEKRPNY